MFNRVLVPIDGSLEGYDIADRAIELASLHEATLYVVFIEVLAPGFAPGGIAQAPTEVTPPDGTDESAALEHVAELAADAGVNCKTTSKRGERHLAILNAAADARADLIIIQAPQRRLWQRLPVTTADRVVRQAETSVLMVQF